MITGLGTTYVKWREAPQRWEYQRVQIDRAGRPVEGDADPAVLGRLGWELVGVLSVGHAQDATDDGMLLMSWHTLPYGVLFFKRSLDTPLPEAEHD